MMTDAAAELARIADVDCIVLRWCWSYDGG